MKNPVRHKGLIAIIVGLVLAIAICAAILIFLFFPGKSRVQEFSIQVNHIDKNISSGFYLKAAEAIKRTFGVAKRLNDVLMLLKRAYRIARFVEKEFFKDMADRGYRLFPGDEKLAYIAAYVATGEKSYSRALSILKKAKKSPSLNRLRLEVSLKIEEDVFQIKNDDKYSTLVALSRTDPPEFFENRGLDLGAKKLLLNAALLYMQAGMKDAAFKLIQQNLPGREFDEPSLFIALDNSAFDTALGRLKRIIDGDPANPAHYVMAGDLSFRKGDPGTAKYSYLRSLNYQEPYSPAVFLNLNNIYQKEGDEASAEIFLNRGIEAFPENAYMVLEKGKLLKKQERFQEARYLLAGFLKDEAFHSDLHFLLLALNRNSLPTEKFHVELWTLFNKSRDNPSVCNILVAELLKSGNAGEALMAMDVFLSNSELGETWWLYHYKGLIKAVNGAYDEAEKLLARSLELNMNSMVHYNMGLVHLNNGKYKKAIENFRHVLELERDNLEKRRVFHSKVVMKIGEAYNMHSEYVKAVRQYQYALEINPDNYRAVLLLKQSLRDN